MPIIGTITTYHGDEHRYLRGYKVKVIGVFKRVVASGPSHDPDDDICVITTDDELERLGGLDANDRVEVQPWLEGEGRFSFVSSDPRVTDLDAFKHLRANG